MLFANTVYLFLDIWHIFKWLKSEVYLMLSFWLIAVIEWLKIIWLGSLFTYFGTLFIIKIICPFMVVGCNIRWWFIFGNSTLGIDILIGKRNSFLFTFRYIINWSIIYRSVWSLSFHFINLMINYINDYFLLFMILNILYLYYFFIYLIEINYIFLLNQWYFIVSKENWFIICHIFQVDHFFH